MDLTEGAVVFVTPAHRHALQGRGDAVLVVSVAFRPDLIDSIGARHPSLAGQLFWAGAQNPVTLYRDSRQLADLNRAALRLERAHRTALEAEAFVLPLCAALLAGVAVVPSAAPAWLARACAAAQDPEVFRDGAAGLTRVCGKAHAHVSRVVRTYLGQTPSDFINDIRMVWAARKLTGTNDSLSEIAADCGLANMSHFHRLFLAHHGITPHQYRRQMQRDLLQPEQ